MKFLVVQGNEQMVNLFLPLGAVIHILNYSPADEYLLDNVDCIVFTGGSDVDPSLYKQVKHNKVWSSVDRDVSEKVLYHKAVELGIPMVGICRGAQFLTVMNGGSLYQHVDGHVNGHPIDVLGLDGKYSTVYASSTHHQMMNPFDLPDDEYILLGYSSPRQAVKYEYMPPTGSGVYGILYHDKIDVPFEPEIVYYPYSDCLCYQPHPEHADIRLNALRDHFYSFVEALTEFSLTSTLLGNKKLDPNKLINKGD